MGNSYKLKQAKYKYAQWSVYVDVFNKTGWLGTLNRKECAARLYTKFDHLSKVTESIDNTD